MKKILTLIAAVSLFTACAPKVEEVITTEGDSTVVTEVTTDSTKVDSTKVDSAVSTKITPVEVKK